MSPAGTSKIRVLCVDDHPLIRDGISFALQFQEDMELVGRPRTAKRQLPSFAVYVRTSR